MILCLPAAVTAFVVPFLYTAVVKFGLENSIFFSCICYAFGLISLGFAVCAAKNVFLSVGIISVCVIGIAFGANMTAETILILNYSRKIDREKNVGIFRAATGIGSAFSPLLISFTSLFMDYYGSFLITGLILLILTPFAVKSLIYVKDKFN